MKTTPSTTSLSAILLSLTRLATKVGAEFTHSIRVDAGGVTMTVFWDNVGGTGRGAISDLPRQATLAFGVDQGAEPTYQFSFVSDPAVFCWAVDEGLTDEQADRESYRLVLAYSEVTNYLLGHPYVGRPGRAAGATAGS